MNRAVFPGLAATLITTFLAVSQPAAAEVVERSADRFVLRYEARALTTPEDITRALTALPQWWDSAHTYSGSAANLSLDLTPGGCWCERLADGTDFDHGRTVRSDGEVYQFAAPFGPLRGRSDRADLTVSSTQEGDRRHLRWEFVIEGQGVGAMADAVDGVMGAGFNRFVDYLSGAGEPITPGPDVQPPTVR
jgi:hypothetical protein